MYTNENEDIFVNKKWLINEAHNVVIHGLVGLVKCNSHLALSNREQVVIRRNYLELTKVKIISGGASGHEPAFAGFVGQGMLTASVQGNIYSSSTPNLIYRTIKELHRGYSNGILVIIGNNISDRLSFDLAIKRAKTIKNMKIKILNMSDDCNKSFGRRGLTGTLFIQKIAGAMAENDICLYDIYVYCKSLLNSISTAVISLNHTVSPIYAVSSCTQKRKSIDFGSGVHGQPGYLQLSKLSSHDAVERLLNDITGKIKLESEVPIVLLINNLGNSSKLEELILINELVTQLQTLNIRIERVYCGSFLTSFEMYGFSVTIFNLIRNDILTYLDAPTSAPFWKCFSQAVLPPETSVTLKINMHPKEIRLKPFRGPLLSEKSGNILKYLIIEVCKTIISCEKVLNLYDSKFGDADTGTNITKCAFEIFDNGVKGKLDFRRPFKLLQEISKLIESNSDSLMSSFYSIMFEAAAQPLILLAENDSLTIFVWSDSLDRVCKSVNRYGRVEEGQNTMYDALNAASKTLIDVITSEITIEEALRQVVEAVELSVKNTCREGSSYPDPGAYIVEVWMKKVYEIIKFHSECIK